MMLLSPASFALSGFLAVIGLLYWLRMPRRTLRLPFSQVAKSILPPATRLKRQSRTLLSLAMQALILGCIVLAAAKPVVGTAASTGRNVIVVLDLSASMLADDSVEFRKLNDEEAMPVNTPVRFNKAIAALRSMVQGLGVSDKLMLIAARRSATIEFNMESDTALMERQIQKLAPCAESANLEAACTLAANTARSLDSCEVVVLTDGAIDPEDLNPLANCGAKTTVRCIVTGQANAGNLGITSFHARKNIDSPSDYEALVTVFSTFDKPRKAEVELLFDGKVSGISEELEVPAHGEASYVFKEKLRVGGVLTARLRVADALSADNSASEILLPNQRLRLLLVSADPDRNSCIRVAIGCNATGVEPKAVTPEIYTSTINANGASSLSEQWDAVIFDRWAPRDARDFPNCHILCFDCLPKAILQKVSEKGETAQPLIRKWDRGHPLMSLMNMRSIFLANARLWDLPREQSKGGLQLEEVTSLVASPLILACEREVKDKSAAARAQRVVCVGFDPRNSDIKLRKELPLLIWNALTWFRTDSEPPTQPTAGAAIEIPLQSSQAAAMTVINPDGVSAMVSAVGSSNRAVYADTAVAGVYQYRTGKLEGKFAVNVGSRRESELRPAANLPAFVNAVSADDSSAPHTTARRLWPLLLTAGLVLLVIEAILFHRRVWF